MKNKILVLDIETTGFLNSNGTIVEIGICELDIITGATRLLFDSCTHETGVTMEMVQNSWIVANSDITVKEIQYSPNLDKIRDEIQDILNMYELGCAAFNCKFDFDFMESRNFSFPKKLDCLMLLLTPVLQLPAKNGKKGNKWPSVIQGMTHYLGIENYKEAHRGGKDCLDEAQIAYKLIQDGYLIV